MIIKLVIFIVFAVYTLFSFNVPAQERVEQNINKSAMTKLKEIIQTKCGSVELYNGVPIYGRHFKQSELDQFFIHRQQRLNKYQEYTESEELSHKKANFYKMEKINLCGANLSQLDLSNRDLSGAVLAFADLKGTIFKNANLINANLSHANLIEAILDQADLQGTNLTNARLELAHLVYANLTGANLTEADLKNAYLRYANLTSANLTNAYLVDSNLLGANLTEAQLEAAELKNANLQSANLTRANLKNTYNLAQTDLKYANLAQANLEGNPKVEQLRKECGSILYHYQHRFIQKEIDYLVKRVLPQHQEWRKTLEPQLLDKTLEEQWNIVHKYHGNQLNLCGADLSKVDLSFKDLSKANLAFTKLVGARLVQTKLVMANLTGVDLREADLKSADLSNAKLDASKLISSSLIQTNLTGTSLLDTNLTNAYLSGANLTKANLSKAKLNHAYLSNADLSYANLSDADLTGANLKNTILSNTNFYRTNLSHSIFIPALDTSPRIATLIPTFLQQAYLFKDVKYYSDAQPINPVFISLRSYFRKNEMRIHERTVTKLIQKGVYEVSWNRGGWEQVSSILSLILFDWTTDYGVAPYRALNILLISIVFFAFIYWLALRFDSKHNQFEMLWESKVRTSNQYRGIKSGKSSLDICHPLRFRCRAKTTLSRLWFEFKIMRVAFYFSLMSAFQIGWRQYNIGSWIKQLQRREIVLRVRKGWIRSVSGFQSLMGLYLLMIWILTQFGRPFD